MFRLGSYFDNPNGVAAYAIVGVATALYLILFLRNKFRYFFIFPALTSSLVGLTTGSRTFVLVFFIFLAIFLFFKFQNHKWIYLAILVSLIVFGIVFINLPFMSTLRERFIRSLGTIFGFENKADTSTISRFLWIDYGFVLGSKNLLFGYGSDGFSIYSGVETYSHSNYAEVICNFGVIGFILFYLPLLLLILYSFKDKKVDKRFIFTFSIYFIITGFSTVLYYKKIYYMILAFMFYLVYIEGKKQKEIKIVSNLDKVLFACDSMGSGGAEKVISILANTMAANGIDVTIIGVGDPNKPKSFYQLDGNIQYLTLGNGDRKRIPPLKRVRLLRKEYLSLKPDIIISFLPNANIYTSLALVGIEIPHIVSERNNPKIDPKGKITRLLKKVSFYFADGAVFQTSNAMNYFPNRIKKRGTIIKNPVLLSKKDSNKNITRNKTVLAVGRLVEQKNYHCLLDAFKAFNFKKNNEYILKIYGDGPLKEELIGYSNKLQIVDKVVFAGNDCNWQDKEYNSSMYVLSSNYEGMPNALAEAMALGIPCISTDCPIGGSKELIIDGVNGYLAPVNDWKVLADKMMQISLEPPTKFSDANKNMANEYSPKHITKLWIEYIKGLNRVISE